MKGWSCKLSTIIFNWQFILKSFELNMRMMECHTCHKINANDAQQKTIIVLNIKRTKELKKIKIVAAQI